MAQHTSTMQVFSDKASLQKHVAELKANQLTIGFVPTMGALHEGHLSLVTKGLEACDKLIVSIFVNPTQFNEKADLDAYPRQVEKDLDVLKIHSEKLLIYTPSVSEMYPDGQQIESVDFGLLTSTMEGKFRPGHFDGMVDIVRRLFDHSQADIA
ncbi:MAG: pantoate--beta-alanine ligase, partial [Polaribacter sp.]